MLKLALALTIIDALLAAGAKVVAYDQEAANNVRALYQGKPNIKIVDEKYEALSGADALLIATEWPEFIESDVDQIAAKLQSPLVFDGRNIFQPETMKKAGFTYYSIGRRPVIQSAAPEL